MDCAQMSVHCVDCGSRLRHADSAKQMAHPAAQQLTACRLPPAKHRTGPAVPYFDVQCLQASGYGPLTGGYPFSVLTSHARALLGSPRPAVLNALGLQTSLLRVSSYN